MNKSDDYVLVNVSNLASSSVKEIQATNLYQERKYAVYKLSPIIVQSVRSVLYLHFKNRVTIFLNILLLLFVSRLIVDITQRQVETNPIVSQWASSNPELYYAYVLIYFCVQKFRILLLNIFYKLLFVTVKTLYILFKCRIELYSLNNIEHQTFLQS